MLWSLSGLEYFGPSQAVTGIECGADSSGYSVILEPVPWLDSSQVKRALATLAGRQVDGIIWRPGDQHQPGLGPHRGPKPPAYCFSQHGAAPRPDHRDCWQPGRCVYGDDASPRTRPPAYCGGALSGPGLIGGSCVSEHSGWPRHWTKTGPPCEESMIVVGDGCGTASLPGVANAPESPQQYRRSCCRQ